MTINIKQQIESNWRLQYTATYW